MDWLTEAFGTKVEHVEIKRPGGAEYYHVSDTGKLVLHTTEGDTVDGAIAGLKRALYILEREAKR